MSPNSAGASRGTSGHSPAISGWPSHASIVAGPDPDGYTYVGQWKNGKRHGKGTRSHYNGDTYVGQYKHDKSHGLGTYTYADGTVFHDGEWENGQAQM